MDNPKLFKICITLRNEFMTESFEGFSFSDKDRLLVNFALQLGFEVHIKTID